jgi:hypothetical protein
MLMTAAARNMTAMSPNARRAYRKPGEIPLAR